MIKVIYNKVCGRCVQSEPLTSGMVGQPIHFEYSHDFDGLTLTAVFTNGKTTVDVLNLGNQCMIPHEVLDTVGTLVKVGIYAVRGNELVIPTVYANIGVVQKGADPSDDVSADPTLPVWAQTQAMIGNLNDLTTEAKNNLVSAINEAAQSGGGGGPTVELDTTLTQSGKAADAKAVGDALAEKQDSGNYVKSVNGTTPDASGNVTVEAGGASDYAELTNKPKINGVELSGNKASADLGIGNPTDAQVSSAVETWLDAHPEATTKIADGSVTEKKTTFFTERFVELFGELEVGFKGNSLSGYHKKMIPVEPGKTYIVNWAGWMEYFDENKAAITEGYTMTQTAGDKKWLNNYTLTIPEDSSLRYIRTTIIDANMTDSMPSCYEGSVNIGEITRGSKLTTFDYADNEKMENAFEVYSGENLIDGSQCTAISGGWYNSQLIPVKPGEKYYKSSSTSQLIVCNHCGKDMPHIWTYPDDWQPDTGEPVIGNGSGVYTIPPDACFVISTTTLTDGNPNHWLVKSPKIITEAQLGKPFVTSTAERETVKEYFDGQHLAGLTLACLGDSVTNMSYYGGTVANKYSMTYIHGGTDGASYTSADGLAANQIAYNKVNSLGSGTDVVVLMFGTNDISNSREIGTFTDNELTTLYGALRKTFDLLTTKFTGKRIGVVTSPQRNFNTCTYDKWKQYNDVIKKMAMLYKIPVLDGEYAGLVYGLANDYSHFTDDVHPTSAGSAALAYNIGKFIESLPIYHRDGE